MGGGENSSARMYVCVFAELVNGSPHVVMPTEDSVYVCGFVCVCASVHVCWGEGEQAGDL